MFPVRKVPFRIRLGFFGRVGLDAFGSSASPGARHGGGARARPSSAGHEFDAREPSSDGRSSERAGHSERSRWWAKTRGLGKLPWEKGWGSIFVCLFLGVNVRNWGNWPLNFRLGWVALMVKYRQKHEV